MKKILMIITASFLISITQQTSAAGAIAHYDADPKEFGLAYTQPSLRDAQIAALFRCHQYCKVIMVFKTGCGAYAVDRSKNSLIFGWGRGSTKAAASKEALERCKVRGKDCVVKASGCTAY